MLHLTGGRRSRSPALVDAAEAGRLSDAQAAALDQRGFFVVHDLLGEDDLAKLRRAFVSTGAESELGRSATGTQHVAISADTPHAEAWRALEQHPALRAAVRHVLGRFEGRADIHGRNPLPGFGQQGLHADWPARRRGEPYAVVTAIWMIDAFTPTNGATRVVPGTHREIRAVPKAFAQPTAHHPDEQIVTAPAGSLLVLNGHLWHSGTRNRSRGPRRAAQVVFRVSTTAAP